MSTFAILINATLTYLAFHFARNGENVISRVLGLGFLIARGGMLILLGSLSDNGLVLLLGTVMLILAGVAWWQGRS